MRVFNQANNSSSSSSNRRNTPSCSYCNDVEHQVTSCPHVKSDWAMFQLFEIPCVDPSNWTNHPKPPESGQGQYWNNQTTTARHYKDPSGWSKWYAACEKALGKIQAKEERDAQKAKAKSQGKKAKSCGFCGGAGHNRRDCSEMTALNNRIIAANNHWRQRLYDTFVLEMGLGEGALIEVTEEVGSWVNRSKQKSVGIVTSINWNELNMFCFSDKTNRAWRTQLDDKIQAPVVIKAQVGDRERTVIFKTTNKHHRVVNDTHGRPLIDCFHGLYNSVEFEKVVSPTETPLPDTWLTEGQSDAVQFVTKRYSLEKLTKWNVIDVLEKYEQRHNL